MPNGIDQYHRLHDRLSNMIEDGYLTRENIPEDYDWLVETLAGIHKEAPKTSVWDDARPDHILHDF